MTTEHEASRTLVKSPPELWAECSDASSLARHLGEFGEITITRLEPESTVAWEGERVSGTVRIEPSAWGTRVTLTAQTSIEGPAVPPATEVAEEVHTESAEDEIETTQEEHDAAEEAALADADPGSVADTGRARARWRRITGRMRGFFGARDRTEEPAQAVSPEAAREPEPMMVVPSAEVELAPVVEPELADAPEPAPASEPEIAAEAILASALDSLGQAHHRPFSRA